MRSLTKAVPRAGLEKWEERGSAGWGGVEGEDVPAAAVVQRERH